MRREEELRLPGAADPVLRSATPVDPGEPGGTPAPAVAGEPS